MIAAIFGLVTALAACGNVHSSTEPLTFGDDESESCISNPAGREVFVGQIAKNMSRKALQITAVSIENATGVSVGDQVIVPMIDHTGFYTERVPSNDPQWQLRIKVADSGITRDEELNVGLVVERTAKSDPGKIERIVVEYSSEGKKYVAKGTMKYLIPDKC